MSLSYACLSALRANHSAACTRPSPKPKYKPEGWMFGFEGMGGPEQEHQAGRAGWMPAWRCIGS